MASPEYYEVHARYTTFLIDGTSITYLATAQFGSNQVGKAVELVAAGTVGLCATGHEVFGKLIKVEADNVATVQDRGYCDLPYDGSPTYTAVNNAIVGGAAAGNVTVAAAVAATAAVRRARAIKADSVANRLIADLG